MTFERLCIASSIEFVDNALERFSALSKQPVIAPTFDANSDAELGARVAGADALIVSWRTRISAELIAANPQLKFIAMSASAFVDPSMSPVDLNAARQHGVVVSSLGQYGDEGTAEWVLAAMLNAAHHIGPIEWRTEPCDLTGKTLGIVGLSHVGTHVAQRARALGMKIIYSSRATKPFATELGYEHLPLDELLQSADIVTVHIGKGIQIMDAASFAHLPTTTLLVNTSIGSVLEPDAYGKWLRAGGRSVSDVTVDPVLGELMANAPNAWVFPQSAGDTYETKQRRGDQLVENLQAFLAGSPIRVVS